MWSSPGNQTWFSWKHNWNENTVSPHVWIWVKGNWDRAREGIPAAGPQIQETRNGKESVMCPLSESMLQLALARQKHKRRHSTSGNGLTASEEAEEERLSEFQLLNGPQEHPKLTPSTTPPASLRDWKASIPFRTDQFGAWSSFLVWECCTSRSAKRKNTNIKDSKGSSAQKELLKVWFSALHQPTSKYPNLHSVHEKQGAGHLNIHRSKSLGPVMYKEELV